jgi:hypothetical protein
MLQTTLSRQGVRIRLTDERWAHIAEEHAEMAGLRLEVLETLALAEVVRQGGQGELLAVRTYEAKKMVVVYKELGEDGFIITAFITSKDQYLVKRKQVWP